MWTRIGKFFTLSLFVLLGSLNISSAEDVSFEATVNANQISLPEALELTLTVHGAKNIPPISIPTIDGFQVRYVGPSTRFLIVNGVSSSEHSFVYNLFPSKTGRFQIPSLSLFIDQKTYSTNPIDIEVIDTPTSSASTADSPAKVGGSIEDKVFLKVSIAPKEVYVGERTPLSMKVYVKDFGLQLSSAPGVKADGFLTDSTANMQKSSENINGIVYETLTFDTNIYPTQPGPLKIGPFQAVGQLVYQVKTGNDIFSDFFGRQEARPIALRADPLTIDVKALPEDGKPSDFSGAIGQYDFKASVGPLAVKLGDPLTLRMTVSGNGRFKNLTMPGLNDSRFKTYDPQIKEDDNSKTVEQVIIPTDQNIKEVPPLSFSYFDPQEKKYKTIIQGPFSISITAPAKGEEFKAYGFMDKTVSEKTSNIKSDGINKLFQFCRGLINQAPTLVKNWRFWFIVIVSIVLWVGIKIWQSFQRRLQNDQAFAKKFNAPMEAKKGFKQAGELLTQNKNKEFYDAIDKTLRNYLAHKMHQPIGSMTIAAMEVKLSQAHVEEKYITDLKEIMERCDQIRFAGVLPDQNLMQKDLQKLQGIVAYLDKKLK